MTPDAGTREFFPIQTPDELGVVAKKATGMLKIFQLKDPRIPELRASYWFRKEPTPQYMEALIELLEQPAYLGARNPRLDTPIYFAQERKWRLSIIIDAAPPPKLRRPRRT